VKNVAKAPFLDDALRSNPTQARGGRGFGRRCPYVKPGLEDFLKTFRCSPEPSPTPSAASPSKGASGEVGLFNLSFMLVAKPKESKEEADQFNYL